MGRRALPKIDTNVDLSRHLHELESLEPPFSKLNLFEKDQPLHLEVGSGKGLFVKTSAMANPTQNFLGLEISHKYAQFAAYRLARDSVSNGVMISGDGLRFVKEFIADESIASVHVYFPDPWWKERHRKRRVMKESFIKDIQRVLMTSGELHFWTDVKEYFETSIELINELTDLDGPLEVKAKEAEHDLDYRTHFERRMRMHDKPVYRSLFVKR